MPIMLAAGRSLLDKALSVALFGGGRTGNDSFIQVIRLSRL